MRIRLHKVSTERHVLEVVRRDEQPESVSCETRSCLVHDLIHLALESEAGLERGFFGQVASGMPLRRDPAGPPPDPDDAAEMLRVESIVGALSAAVEGRPPGEVVAALRNYAEAGGPAVPAWLTTPLVAAVQERMRHYLGRWRATPAGGTMEFPWPDPSSGGPAVP